MQSFTIYFRTVSEPPNNVSPTPSQSLPVCSPPFEIGITEQKMIFKVNLDLGCTIYRDNLSKQCFPISARLGGEYLKQFIERVCVTSKGKNLGI